MTLIFVNLYMAQTGKLMTRFLFDNAKYRLTLKISAPKHMYVLLLAVQHLGLLFFHSYSLYCRITLHIKFQYAIGF